MAKLVHNIIDLPLLLRIVWYFISRSSCCYCTSRYYGSILPYGSGDTIIETIRIQGGSSSPLRKWNAECLDGEALIGIRDSSDDFARIQGLWCKYMFPYKPPSAGLYPYYPNCYTRNLSNEVFCYNPADNRTSPNTFATAFFDDDPGFSVARPGDNTNLYKCCLTPKGYHVDYLSCYYRPTHDQFFEYYDTNIFLTFCDTGYVITGMAKKLNPYSKEFHIDWIHCCRVGI